MKPMVLLLALLASAAPACAQNPIPVVGGHRAIWSHSVIVYNQHSALQLTKGFNPDSDQVFCAYGSFAHDTLTVTAVKPAGPAPACREAGVIGSIDFMAHPSKLDDNDVAYINALLAQRPNFVFIAVAVRHGDEVDTLWFTATINDDARPAAGPAQS